MGFKRNLKGAAITYVILWLWFMFCAMLSAKGQVRFDTIPQIIICIDTSISSPTWLGDKLFWIKGYEVITSDLVATIHVAYLDEKKRPIKYIGLMTK
jgi:hypothetical protein